MKLNSIILSSIWVSFVRNCQPCIAKQFYLFSGEGQFGKVYSAVNLDTGELMAVKQVDKKIVCSDIQSSK